MAVSDKENGMESEEPAPFTDRWIAAQVWRVILKAGFTSVRSFVWGQLGFTESAVKAPTPRMSPQCALRSKAPTTSWSLSRK
jgi:hypothetical protein